MNKAYLLTGGNIGDREGMLESARNMITRYCGVIEKKSAIYETEAWGLTDQPAFLNQALILSTALSAQDLLTKLLYIEQKTGRLRDKKYGPRTIDIDILLFNQDVILEQNLEIPHPRLQNRRFALRPLAEIAGTLIHPQLQKSIDQLLAECSDELAVNIFKPREESLDEL